MKINVNLDDVKEYVEEGWYVCRVLGVETRKKKDGDSQYLNWELEIAEGEDEGFKVWYMTSLKPTARRYLKRWIKALDVEWDEDGFHTEDCVGQEIELYLTIDEYQGELDNEVDKFRKL